MIVINGRRASSCLSRHNKGSAGLWVLQVPGISLHHFTGSTFGFAQVVALAETGAFYFCPLQGSNPLRSDHLLSLSNLRPIILHMSKLHPIYVALDNHQFNRAIKLALALPDSNILGKALLAHAYSKSGQRFLSLVTLHKILSSVAGPGNYFCELKQEVEYALEAIEEREQQASKPSVNTAPEPSAAKSKGGKKGGKKKPTSSSIPATTTATKEMDEQFLDLLDQLNTRPTLPENWDTLPGAANAITDEVRKRQTIESGP